MKLPKLTLGVPEASGLSRCLGGALGAVPGARSRDKVVSWLWFPFSLQNWGLQWMPSSPVMFGLLSHGCFWLSLVPRKGSAPPRRHPSWQQAAAPTGATGGALHSRCGRANREIPPGRPCCTLFAGSLTFSHLELFLFLLCLNAPPSGAGGVVWDPQSTHAAAQGALSS